METKEGMEMAGWFLAGMISGLVLAILAECICRQLNLNRTDIPATIEQKAARIMEERKAKEEEDERDVKKEVFAKLILELTDDLTAMKREEARKRAV